ncbi:MAG TPA: hypothetical protein VH255_06690, partial [Verrucomicrobiae bacterium]|nr:hypothetical protein [Verrucomicrobiae bacterium]
MKKFRFAFALVLLTAFSTFAAKTNTVSATEPADVSVKPGARPRLNDAAHPAADATNVCTIYMVGDSTMSNKPLIPEYPERGWGQLLPLYFKSGVHIENYAMNGRSTKSFIAEGRWQAVRE